MASKCTKKTIQIRKKGSRKVIAEFVGHSGSGCAPRKPPSTRHLSAWKSGMKKAAPQCKRASGGNVKAYRRCVGQAMKSIHG